MPAAQTLNVSTATKAGSRHKPNEDRVFAAADVVVLLDGATGSASPRTGGWYAQGLGETIVGQLERTPERDLARVLADSIFVLADRHGLVPGECPMATTSIVRVRSDMLDVLVLGDSPVVLRTQDGRIQSVDDQRLQRVAVTERARLRAAGEAERAAVRSTLLKAEAKCRNRPGGYWIAEADPEAAYHALSLSVPFSEVDAALIVSDGVSAGVERYGCPGSWEEALHIASQSPSALIDCVLDAELTDPERVRWRRSKRHDDKTVAHIRIRD